MADGHIHILTEDLIKVSKYFSDIQQGLKHETTNKGENIETMCVVVTEST